ncbi:hypothetical protein DC429_16615 [Arthrobacter sp. TPD3018]|nr:hypothetical protein DC425_16120 [Sphingomonas sp. TPD3009]PVE52631.1 hypothetical protein DC429_16615 [Arthrobacter sp. TPD3018]PVE80759.1 hypothetical protein DC431_16005 [Sphingomonas melonis]
MYCAFFQPAIDKQGINAPVVAAVRYRAADFVVVDFKNFGQRKILKGFALLLESERALKSMDVSADLAPI